MATEEKVKTEFPLIYQKIPKIMASVGVIGKDRKNTAQNYKFRGIDDIYNALNQHLASEKVFCVPEVITDTSESFTDTDKFGKPRNGYRALLTMKYTFFAEDGSSIVSTMKGEATDYSDKATNKAMSAAQKYAFLQIFCIPTDEDKDSEVDSPPLPPEKKDDEYSISDKELEEMFNEEDETTSQGLVDSFGKDNFFGSPYTKHCDKCADGLIYMKDYNGKKFPACNNYGKVPEHPKK